MPKTMILIICLLILGLFDVVSIHAQDKPTHIGYIYPAGAQQGTTVRVLVGGQRLKNAKEVIISGEGVTGKVIEHYPNLGNLGEDRRRYLRYHMTRLATEKWNTLKANGKVTGKAPAKMGISTNLKEQTFTEAELKEIHKSKHYLFNGWEEMSLRELVYTYRRLTRRNKLQPNAQISEAVLVEITVEPGAVLGDRELRLQGGLGLSQPMKFQIGDLPERNEIEGNDPHSMARLPEPEPFNPPVLINGQILPGDVDQLKFHAKTGQSLVIEVQARHLVPFMPDAVPGWFQPTLTVFDAEGNPLQFADDFHFDPDPVVLFKAPSDGVYTLMIHDSIYRGREDFVYRIRISEKPYVYAVYPLGVQSNDSSTLTLKGWNLPTQQLTVSTKETGVQALTLPEGWRHSPLLKLQVNDRQTIDEKHIKNTLELPVIINGQISEPQEKDRYSFTANAGEHITVTLDARRLGSSLDGLIRVLDADGKTIAWQDDTVDKQGHLHRGMGVLTHFADTHLDLEIPKDGVYTVVISDVTQQASDRSTYCLHINHTQPDFQVFMEPSAVTLRYGMSVPLVFHVKRTEGFEGPVRIETLDLPAGYELTETIIPAGVNRIRVTLTAPNKTKHKRFELKTQGVAFIGDKTIIRQSQPVDDQMQAFLWRHLLPRDQCLVFVAGRSKANASRPELVNRQVIKLAPGKSHVLRYKLSKAHSKLKDLQIKLNAGPEGISVKRAEILGSHLEVELTCDASVKSAIDLHYLIFELATIHHFKRKSGKPGTRVQFLGYLPAIPLKIQKATP